MKKRDADKRIAAAVADTLEGMGVGEFVPPDEMSRKVDGVRLRSAFKRVIAQMREQAKRGSRKNLFTRRFTRRKLSVWVLKMPGRPRTTWMGVGKPPYMNRYWKKGR